MNEYEITYLGADGLTTITRKILAEANVPLWEVLQEFTEDCGGSLEIWQVSNLTASNKHN